MAELGESVDQLFADDDYYGEGQDEDYISEGDSQDLNQVI